MSEPTATSATTEAKTEATSADSIKTELEKVSGDGLKGQRGALQLASQGVVLTNLDDAWRFATLIQSTGLAPKDMNTPAKILLAMQMGMEVGLPPMASIQNIAVINGRPSLWGDVCLGLCRKSGLFDEEAFDQTWDIDEQGNATAAHCTVRRLPNGKLITWTFTWREAIAAKLDAKDTYKSYRKRMLMNRARAFALRDGFADVLKGVLIAEEAQDLPPRNITPEGPAPARPTNLDELTEQLNGSATEQTVVDETVAPEQTSVGDEAAAIDEAVTTRTSLVPPGFTARLASLNYVTAVEKLLVEYTGPESTLKPAEKDAVAAACRERIVEIKQAKKNGGSKQPTLV